jgi:ubiquitin-conjugating enzyme E2 variant
LSVSARRPPWASWLERLAVVLFLGLWVSAGLRFIPSLTQIETGLAAGLGAISGYLLADLLSGSVHWLADRYFAPETPWIGSLLIAPFRDHHADEEQITRHDFFEVSGNNALVTLPVVLLLVVVPRPDARAAIDAALIGLGLGLSAAVFLTNQFHCWAHTTSPPALARRLQRWGWILTSERHALHHSGDHDRAYCVTSGWLNPLLDRVRFFATLERLIETLMRRRGSI